MASQNPMAIRFIIKICIFWKSLSKFTQKPRNKPILLIGLFKILNPDSVGLKPGQSCWLQASDRSVCVRGHPSSPKFPLRQAFEQDLVPPPQVTEQEPKSEHSSITKKII